MYKADFELGYIIYNSSFDLLFSACEGFRWKCFTSCCKEQIEITSKLSL